MRNQMLLIEAIKLSWIITALYVSFQKGMFLGKLRAKIATFLDRKLIARLGNQQGRKWSTYIQKPFWDCLPCMSSVWGLLLSWSLDIELILVICGINAIIDKILDYE